MVSSQSPDVGSIEEKPSARSRKSYQNTPTNFTRPHGVCCLSKMKKWTTLTRSAAHLANFRIQRGQNLLLTNLECISFTDQICTTELGSKIILSFFYHYRV